MAIKRTILVGCLATDDSHSPFSHLFSATLRAYDMDSIKYMKPEDMVILFRGGTDIHPSMYGAKRISLNGAEAIISIRDSFEREVFKYAVEHKIPMLGICRGSQL